MRALAILLLLACSAQTPPEHNALSAAERAAGWRLLFDGHSTAGWRCFKKDSVTGWRAEDGALVRVGPACDIVTDDQFANFELTLEWNVAPGGNSGIFFRVTDAGNYVFETGPEMQVLDDSGHADGQSRLTAAGSDFALHAAPAGVVRPAGQWNQVRLVVNGAHVEHWLNGQKVVEYELWSPEWKALVKASKFKGYEGFGRALTGRIALQDHGDRVAFRDIKIRVLP